MSAVSLWKEVRALEGMGADKDTVTAAKALKRNAILCATMLNTKEGASTSDNEV